MTRQRFTAAAVPGLVTFAVPPLHATGALPEADDTLVVAPIRSFGQ